MANQLTTLQAASKQPVYKTLDLSEFGVDGKLMFRVNPTRASMREVQAAQETGDLDAMIRLTAQLIPLDTDAPDVTMTYEQFKAWLEGGNEDDAAFPLLVVRRIWEMVGQHFLALTNGSKAN